jgi:plasmid stability protein
MPAIHVREVDDAVIDALKARAARNHRSLQGEIRAILEEAAHATKMPARGKGRRLRIKTVQVGTPIPYSREVIYDDESR